MPVQIGDKIRTDAFIKVRVTTYGDFAVQDYRVRAIAGIVDTSELSGCGFGIEPFGLLPFGDCTATVIEEAAIQPQRFAGRLGLSGSLQISSTITPPAAWVSASGSTTAFSAGTTYFALTTNGLRGALGSVAIKLSAPIVLKSLWARLAAALPGGVGASNVVFKYVVNGAPSNDMVVTLTSDGGVTAHPLGSATGTLALNEGDTIAVQAVFTSGSGSCQVQSLSGGYTP